MFNKFEIIGASLSIAMMALAIYLVQAQSFLFSSGKVDMTAQVVSNDDAVVKVVSDQGNTSQARANALLEASDEKGKIKNMVIDDIKVGTGAEVQNGDTVSVHYIGTLQSGEEFDNSKKRGEPFEFKVGSGMVIKGWDEGLLGMKVGGQRVLVIPPDKAYGEQGIGPIPPNSTLVFAIELVDIK